MTSLSSLSTISSIDTTKDIDNSTMFSTQKNKVAFPVEEIEKPLGFNKIRSRDKDTSSTYQI